MEIGKLLRKQADSRLALGLVTSAVGILLAAPALARQLPFRPGEKITLTVSWSDRVAAASMVLSVGQRQAAPGGGSLPLSAEIKPSAVINKLYPVYYKMESLLEEASLLPQKASMYSRERSRVRRKFTYFDRRAGSILYTYVTDREQKKTLPGQPGTLDILSLLYVLRAMPWKEGTIGPFQVAENGKLFSVRFQLARSAPVKTELGELPVWRLTPRVESADGTRVAGNMVLWMSGDQRRLPLRLQAELPVGKFVAMMSAYSQ